MGNLSRQRGASTGRLASAGVIANAATVAAAMLVENTLDGWISVDALLVLGSLTNITITPLVSMDGTSWHILTDPGALGPLASPLNANGYGFACNCKGWKWFAVQLSSTGVTTGSSAAITYRYSTAGGVAS